MDSETIRREGPRGGGVKAGGAGAGCPESWAAEEEGGVKLANTVSTNLMI